MEPTSAVKVRERAIAKSIVFALKDDVANDTAKVHIHKGSIYGNPPPTAA